METASSLLPKLVILQPIILSHTQFGVHVCTKSVYTILKKWLAELFGIKLRIIPFKKNNRTAYQV